MQALSFSFVFLLGLVAAQDVTSTFNFSLPAEYTNHGNPDLLYHPARWTDYISFYFENYVIHAATLIGEPGQNLATTVLSMILALLFPSFGVCRALESMLELPRVKGRTSLQVAARAGALCQVIEDMPRDRDLTEAEEQPTSESHSKAAIEMSTRANFESTKSTMEKYVEWLNDHRDPSETLHASSSEYRRPRGYERITVHGCADLPLGFVLERIPADAKFDKDEPPESTWEGSRRIASAWTGDSSPMSNKSPSLLSWNGLVAALASCSLCPLVFIYLKVKKAWIDVMQPSEAEEPAIACSYNTVGILVSISQLMFSAITYYRNRGDQVDRHGYAAFGRSSRTQ